MRFDDTLATVLAQPAANAAARAAKWRQLVDLLAQRREHLGSREVDEALAFLRHHRSEIDGRVRTEIARALAGRRVSPLLIRFFGEDHPAIATPIIATARLSAEEWLDVLPAMSPTARALLRHRRDLPHEVTQALAAFGSSDFVLAGTLAPEAGRTAGAGPNPSAEGGEAQIRELVARIEEFRERKRRSDDVQESSGPAAALVEAFRWETGADGVIIWVEDAPRGPLIGQTIATIADRGQYGVDGQAAGAFEKRAPFRNARFSVVGAGAVSGDWRISGVPFFDPRRGNFLGYRGSARRPRVDEVARAGSIETSSPGLFGTDVSADALRQLIHELRTPLNAIVGFAELIDGQYMGPAGAPYRSRAKEIMEQAGKLLSAVDDLDTAARIATSRLVLDESSVDAVALLYRLHDSYQTVAGQRNSTITIEAMPDLPPAKLEPATAERMIARMLAATIGLAQDGEAIAAAMTMGQVAGQEMLCLALDRPKAIAGLDEAALLDPGYSPDGDWPGAPALGLGFALRLVRNLAEAAGGALIVGDRHFFLYLPPLEPAGRSLGQGG